jgi:predicted phage terminase large subunit-like protein
MPKNAQNLKPPSVAEIERALCEKYLRYFVKAAWPQVDKEDLVWGKHMDIVCDALQATLTNQGPQNLLINVPPGSSKSLLTSVFAPAWVWLRNPKWSAVYASGNEKVSTRDSMKCRDLIKSEWYIKTFQPKWRISDDQDTKTQFRNTVGGSRIALTVGGDVTGIRADSLNIDDPLDAKDAPSKLKRDSANYWYDTAFANRVNNARKSTRIIIAQRLHEEDLPGHVIAHGNFHHICLPMEYEPNHPYVCPLDWRTKEGELLDPERFPKNVLNEELARLGSSGYAGQLQQRPMPAGGGMFQDKWWRFYRKSENDLEVGVRPHGSSQHIAVVLPESFDEIITSLDANFKEADDNDFVALQTWGRKGSNKYLLARYKARVGFIGTCDAIRVAARQRYGKTQRCPSKHLVEDKANGPAIIETLKDKISGMLAVNPEGGKESRASAVSPQVEAGNVFLPDGAPWLDEFIGEHSGFPKAAHDDEVDACSQALLYLADRETSFAVRFRAAVKDGRIQFPGDRRQ